MTARLQRLQQKWAAEALPLLDIGIGINLGIATIGNFGSANRFDYTIIGDTVNAASRLEALNKEYNSHVIISESTKEQVTFPIHTLDLGEVAIKGKEKPMHVFEVLAR
jgi:adenylate cyclase